VPAALGGQATMSREMSMPTDPAPPAHSAAVATVGTTGKGTAMTSWAAHVVFVSGSVDLIGARVVTDCVSLTGCDCC